MRKTLIIERRLANLQDLRVQDGPKLLFRGHAAVFEPSTTDLGPYRERVKRGAFLKTLREADIRFLVNHEPDSICARSKNGTLRLSEDARGLLAEADLDPEDVDVARLVPKLRQGLVTGMSYAFSVVGKDGESWEEHPADGGKPVRTLREVRLYDVSACTYPANPETDGGLRASIHAVAERRGIAWSDPGAVPPAPRLAAYDAASLQRRLEALAIEAADVGVPTNPVLWLRLAELGRSLRAR